MISETRERFLQAILERIPAERIVELHLFTAIRQGPMETGVAVIAATPEPRQDVAEEAPRPDVAEEGPPPELALEFAVHADLDASRESADSPRTEVVTASYRWTRKGPERGKWEVDIVTQADAPLATVETVVRGVQERAGEALDAHRITGAELRDLLANDPSFAGARAAAG